MQKSETWENPLTLAKNQPIKTNCKLNLQNFELCTHEDMCGKTGIGKTGQQTRDLKTHMSVMEVFHVQERQTQQHHHRRDVTRMDQMKLDIV